MFTFELWVMLENLGSERNDLHVCCTKFACYGAEDTGTAELAGVVEQDTSVVVKADIAAVGTTDLFLCADNDCLADSAFLYIA